MERSLASLGDFFPDQGLECAVPGCGNICLDAAEQASARSGDGLPVPVCDECRALFSTLADRELPCAREDCTQTWIWPRMEQLVACRQAGAGRTDAPRGLCADCREQATALGDLPVPCIIPDCDKTWTWPAVERFLSDTGVPEARMCDDCGQKINRLHDRDVACVVEGCRGSWQWSAREQLEEALRLGRTPRRPPERLCGQCRERLAGLSDREVPCRVADCRRTWTLTAEAQLRHMIMHGEEDDPATDSRRMCDECFAFLQEARPRQVPCRIRGCRGTWLYTTRRQVEDFARGRHRPPLWLCSDCRAQLRELRPVDCPCSTPGCQGAWVWSEEEQLRERLRQADRGGEVRPPQKRCAECEEHLRSHTTQTLFCNDCGQQISWSPYEQLLWRRGAFAKPIRCSECAAKAVAGKQPRPEDFIRHSQTQAFAIPARGPWLREARIAHRPVHLDHGTLERLGQADLRILAFGDQATAAAPRPEQAWPLLLEQVLNQRLRDHAITVAVANLGIDECDSRLAVLRIERDVLPFKPALTICSFVFADSCVPCRSEPSDIRAEPAAEEGEVGRAEQELMRRLLASPGKLLYWLPNPIFPQVEAGVAADEGRRAWANAVDSRFRQTRARVAHLCQSHDVPLLDAGSRFEVNGSRSAGKWMCDSYYPNQAGLHNIANWLAESILHHGLLPVQ